MTTGADIVAAAQRLLGDPYKYGATGPDSFDCSGLVQYVFRQSGITLPRTSEEQYGVGTAIAEGDLQPGDLVFSAGSDGTASSPGHVGIYAGGGQVIVAPHTGTDVQVQQLSGFGAVGYRRPPGLDTATASQAGLVGSVGSGVLGGLTDGATGGLLSIPQDITGFFSGAAEDLTASANFLRAFFEPSTYVRIGAGVFGSIFLLAGIFFLAREVINGN